MSGEPLKGAPGVARVADQLHAVDPDVVLYGRGQPFNSLNSTSLVWLMALVLWE
jgi:hypothetical protein